MRILFFMMTLFLGSSQMAFSQILFSESFNVIIDTSRTIKGSVVPDLKFQTLKVDLIEIENIADVSFRFRKKNAFTFANKIELSKLGKTVILSGGYLYAEYRKLLESKFALEPYGQIQWAEARGMEWKHAGGINVRYRMLEKTKVTAFAGIGPFYEFERWNYDGVPDEVELPSDLKPLERESVKLGSYISFKINASEKLFFDLSAYHQSRFEELFTTPRIGTSAIARWSFTKYFGLNIIHQFIYDAKPLVPIRKNYHKFNLGFSFNF